jgi:hypothetical protein
VHPLVVRRFLPKNQRMAIRSPLFRRSLPKQRKSSAVRAICASAVTTGWVNVLLQDLMFYNAHCGFSQLVFFNPCNFHKVPQQANF